MGRQIRRPYLPDREANLGLLKRLSCTLGLYCWTAEVILSTVQAKLVKYLNAWKHRQHLKQKKKLFNCGFNWSHTWTEPTARPPRTTSEVLAGLVTYYQDLYAAVPLDVVAQQGLLARVDDRLSPEQWASLDAPSPQVN